MTQQTRNERGTFSPKDGRLSTLYGWDAMVDDAVTYMNEWRLLDSEGTRQNASLINKGRYKTLAQIAADKSVRIEAISRNNRTEGGRAVCDVYVRAVPLT